MNKQTKDVTVIRALSNTIYRTEQMIKRRQYTAIKLLLVLAMLFSNQSFAYNVDTSIIMTKEAAKRSVLSDESLWREWGIESGTNTLLNVEGFMPMSITEWNQYLAPRIEGDRNGIMQPGRRLQYPELMAFGADLEESELDVTATLPINVISALGDLLTVLQNARKVGKISPKGLLIEAALSQFLGATDNAIPEDFGASRTYSHYFNPQVDKKLSDPMVSAILRATNYTSPDWILEDRQSIAEQRFSYADAMDAFYHSLTATLEFERLDSLSLSIYTLGHVVHHIQDMTLPQQTREDFHCDTIECVLINEVIERNLTFSPYEIFIEELQGCTVFDFPNATPRPLGCVINRSGSFAQWYSVYDANTLALNSYPVVDVESLVGTANVANFTPRDFWTNARKSGIADFSSENFITTNTAFSTAANCLYCDHDLGNLEPHSDDLPLPSGVPSAVDPEGIYLGDKVRLADLISPRFHSNYTSGFINTEIQFVGKAIRDNYTNQLIQNDRMASLSIFQERLDRRYTSGNRRATVQPRFTTNYFNYDEQVKILMPRAVGYSAGLINHFFGHRFTLSYDAERLEVTLTNTGKYPLDGQLEFHYDDDGGIRREIISFFNHNGDIRLPVGSSRRISVNENEYPEDASGNFTIVYRGHGDISLENSGVAGSVVFIEEPNLCTDSEMALWVANDNEIIDDTFNFFVNGDSIGRLDFGANRCNGYMYLNSNVYNNTLDKSDITIHPLVQAGFCLDDWVTDSTSDVYFSPNVPQTMENSTYSYFMDNIRQNDNTNHGIITAFQVCTDDNGGPIIRRVLATDEYIMQGGQDYEGSFETGACLPCD